MVCIPVLIYSLVCVDEEQNQKKKRKQNNWCSPSGSKLWIILLSALKCFCLLGPM